MKKSIILFFVILCFDTICSATSVNCWEEYSNVAGASSKMTAQLTGRTIVKVGERNIGYHYVRPIDGDNTAASYFAQFVDVGKPNDSDFTSGGDTLRRYTNVTSYVNTFCIVNESPSGGDEGSGAVAVTNYLIKAVP